MAIITLIIPIQIEKKIIYNKETRNKLSYIEKKNHRVSIEEDKFVSTSLTSLCDVIDCLKHKKLHIPYRSSKLTRALQVFFKYLL